MRSWAKTFAAFLKAMAGTREAYVPKRPHLLVHPGPQVGVALHRRPGHPNQSNRVPIYRVEYEDRSKYPAAKLREIERERGVSKRRRPVAA